VILANRERGWSSRGSQVGVEARRGRIRPGGSSRPQREEGETGAEEHADQPRFIFYLDLLDFFSDLDFA
jgi:hypothetical protein